MGPIRALWQWLKPHRARLALALCLIVLQAAVNVALPLVLGVGIVDYVLLQMKDPALLTWVAVGVVILILFKGIITYAQTYSMNYVGQRLVTDLRGRMYDHLLRLPLGFYGQRQSGELISRLTNDVAAIQQAVTLSISEVLQYVLVLGGILAGLFWLHWQMALVALIVLPVAGLAVSKYGARIRAFSKRMHEKIGDMAALLGETIGAMRIVKAFVMEGQTRRRFREANERSFDVTMKSVQAQATLKPIVELILVAGMVLVLWYGGREVLAGRLTVGELMAFLGYLGMLSQPVSALTYHFSLIQQAAAAGERIAKLLAVAPEPQGSGQLKELPPVKGRIEFENVTFGYDPSSPVLRNVTLTIEPGQVVALVGPSGAGKSTLVNLIPRFYDPDEGVVRVDGYDLREIDPKSLRRQIGLVPQDPVLFGMTLSENIAVSRPNATQEEVERAAVLANAHDFIMQLPNGYDTMAGERGANLSGGQRQRIAIARAILADPRILILDEATSALDAESEAAIHDALARLRHGRTVILIAHRASTVRLADRIVVMDRGRIVQDGTHAELIRQPGLYRRLYAELLGSVDDDAVNDAVVPAS
ncbi:MAG: ABC transporter ATP-binding protein [Limnochordales bacterium]|nr:ABC transporter ATP-binding protein [Bacillota bacterium]